MSTTELELTAPPELAGRSRRVTTAERAVFKPFLRWSCLWETTGALATPPHIFLFCAWHLRYCVIVAAVQRMNDTLALTNAFTITCFPNTGWSWMALLVLWGRTPLARRAHPM
jgi:hypothetical protein